MRKAYPKRHASSKKPGRNPSQENSKKSWAVQLPLGREDLVAMMQDALASFATELGLRLAVQLLEDEVTRRCGPRYERRPDRDQTRYGHQPGFVTMAGQKLPVRRPRVRSTAGQGEVELETYGLLQSETAMPEAALKRMVRGVSCRDYEGVVDLACEGFGVKKSSISRAFVRASASEVEQVAQRRFEGLRLAAILIDGVEYAGECMVVALGIAEDGTKHVLGLRQGGTENAQVCSSLLEELRERGLDTGQPVLLVLDGAKALHSAVKRVWGKNAVIQRCQIHKRRNVQAHLPEKHHAELSRQLSMAYHETDYERALKALQTAVAWLQRLSPSAAASLREGLEETLTVVRLGVPELLRKSLATTNVIESALSVTRYVTGRVKRWRDGDMRQRWCAAGLLRAESKFRRVRGHRHLPQLIASLKQVVQGKPIDAERKRA
jgi:transposase-like protein